MGTLTLEQMSYISDIVGVIAVATTLIILVFEMRQGNRRQQADALRIWFEHDLVGLGNVHMSND